MPVTGGIHRQDGEHVAAKAKGHGGAGLPLPLQQRGIVTGQIIGLAGAGVTLIGEIEGYGGDGIEQDLSGVAGIVARLILGIGHNLQRAIHQFTGYIAKIGFPDQTGQHHGCHRQRIACLINESHSDRLAHLHIKHSAADDDASRFFSVDDVVAGLGFGDSDGGKEIALFRK